MFKIVHKQKMKNIISIIYPLPFLQSLPNLSKELFSMSVHINTFSYSVGASLTSYLCYIE